MKYDILHHVNIIGSAFFVCSYDKQSHLRKGF